jgi:hypothetical protein
LRSGGRRSSRSARGARRRRPGSAAGDGAVVATIALRGSLSTHALETLKLELRRLALACHLDIRDIRVETVSEDGPA